MIIGSGSTTTTTSTTTSGNNDGTSSNPDNDEGCGNDEDCGCGDNVDCEEAGTSWLTSSPTPHGYISHTPSPTSIDYAEVTFSNDQDFWWRGRSNSSTAADSGNGSNSGTYFVGAFAVGGIAVAALVARRRVSSNSYLIFVFPIEIIL